MGDIGDINPSYHGSLSCGSGETQPPWEHKSLQSHGDQANDRVRCVVGSFPVTLEQFVRGSC